MTSGADRTLPMTSSDATYDKLHRSGQLMTSRWDRNAYYKHWSGHPCDIDCTRCMMSTTYDILRTQHAGVWDRGYHMTWPEVPM
jgi:hypothetical protein